MQVLIRRDVWCVILFEDCYHSAFPAISARFFQLVLMGVLCAFEKDVNVKILSFIL